MEIPVKNIYYLLCYAWDKLDEGEIKTVADSDYDSLLELFTRVLLNGCSNLFKRGLERNYILRSEQYAGIKGKLIIGDSLKRNSFEHGSAVCEFDEFEVNTIHNQILKATLWRLYKTEGVPSELRQTLRYSFERFASVDHIELSLRSFSGIKIHRNNANYDFLLKLCRLIYDSTVIEEQTGKYQFRDFVRDDFKMAALFEAFVRNFYRKHLVAEYKVTTPGIKWAAEPIEGSDLSMLPGMLTDIVLESTTRKIIIDAKYYREALKVNYERARFYSPNLYQLYSYLRNTEADLSNPLNASCEGILLYPVVEYELDQTYKISGHLFSIKTVNLGGEWKEVERELLRIIEIPTNPNSAY